MNATLWAEISTWPENHIVFMPICPYIFILSCQNKQKDISQYPWGPLTSHACLTCTHRIAVHTSRHSSSSHSHLRNTAQCRIQWLMNVLLQSARDQQAPSLLLRCSPSAPISQQHVCWSSQPQSLCLAWLILIVQQFPQDSSLFIPQESTTSVLGDTGLIPPSAEGIKVRSKISL